MFRTSQKYIEKELGAVQTSASDLSKRAQATGSEQKPDDSVKAIDAMITRVENLKRKVRLGMTSTPQFDLIQGLLALGPPGILRYPYLGRYAGAVSASRRR